jgi:hypothetical protein
MTSAENPDATPVDLSREIDYNKIILTIAKVER